MSFFKQELSEASINLINNYKKYIFDNSQKELEKIINDNINMIDKLIDLIKRNNDISNNILNEIKELENLIFNSKEEYKNSKVIMII